MKALCRLRFVWGLCAVAGAQEPLRLTVGKSALIDNALPIERVAVGLGDIAQATVVSPREVLLNAKQPGETSLIIWQEGGTKRWFDVSVESSHRPSGSRIESIERQLHRELPGQEVGVSVEDNTVFLRGKVRDMLSADRAVTIASSLGKTVNLLYVDVPPAEPQILLRVKFASVDRSVSAQVGVNLFSTGATNTHGVLSTQQFSPPRLASQGTSDTVTISDALNLFLFRPDLNLGATIQALEVKGLLQILAEPNLLAQNGKEASFLAGGEFPFPTVQGAGATGPGSVTIQFREFGVRLGFLPAVTPRGTIRMWVAPEVSALDFTNGLTVNGFNVPALTVRKMKTEVELSQGQSFAIGGLLDRRVTETMEKIPFIGDLPILGKLFQSKSQRKQNTELMVIVTPELVPAPGEAKPAPEIPFPAEFLDSARAEEASPAPSMAPVSKPREAIPIEVLLKPPK